MKKFFNNLNGWQRVFTLLVLIWIPVFLFFNWEFPPTTNEIPADFRASIVKEELKKVLPKKAFDPDIFLTERSRAEGLALLNNTEYLNSTQGTKRALFNKLIASDGAYINANEATKEAIRSRFGIKGIDLLKNSQEGIVDPFKVEQILRDVKSTASSREYVYEMDDGTYIESQQYSEADIKESYVKVKAKLKHDDQITLLTAIFNKMLILILPLVAIYGLGWIFGWIYRGFSKG